MERDERQVLPRQRTRRRAAPQDARGRRRPLQVRRPTSSRAASAPSSRTWPRLDGDLQKIVKDDRSVIDAKTGNRNEFLRGVGRKLDLTVTGFNAFRSDPQLKQIRIDLADRAEKTTITGAKGVVISCPDGQLQMALRGVVRAIDQLPELEKPKIAAVEGSEAVIEAFRRLTTTFFGLLSFKLPPSADELRELQRKAVQSVEGGSSPLRPVRRAGAALSLRRAVGPCQARLRAARRRHLRRPVPAARVDRPAGQPASSGWSAACARPRRDPSTRSWRASTTSTPTPRPSATSMCFATSSSTSTASIT